MESSSFGTAHWTETAFLPETPRSGDEFAGFVVGNSGLDSFSKLLRNAGNPLSSEIMAQDSNRTWIDIIGESFGLESVVDARSQRRPRHGLQWSSSAEILEGRELRADLGSLLNVGNVPELTCEFSGELPCLPRESREISGDIPVVSGFSVEIEGAPIEFPIAPRTARPMIGPAPEESSGRPTNQVTGRASFEFSTVHSALQFPWRITAGVHSEQFDYGDQFTTVDLTLLDQTETDSNAPVSIPELSRFRLEGEVRAGEAADLYAVSLVPFSQSFGIGYQRRMAEMPPGQSFDWNAARVWVLDEDGQTLAEWILESDDVGVQIQFEAVGPPTSEHFVVGIESLDSDNEDSLLSYELYVADFENNFEPITYAPRLLPGTESVPSVGGGTESLSLIELGTLLAAPSTTLQITNDAPILAQTLGGSVDLSSVDAALSFFVSDRPLPTQAAGTSGGLLPTGPDIRPSSEAPIEIQFGDLDPSILLKEESANLPVPADELVAGLLIDQVEDRAQSPADDPSFRVHEGLGGAPLIAASLRAPRMEELRLPQRETARDQEDPESTDLNTVAQGSIPTDELSALRIPAGSLTRPTIFRSATLTAAALGICLVLPELSSDQPSVARRWTSFFRLQRLRNLARPWRPAPN